MKKLFAVLALFFAALDIFAVEAVCFATLAVNIDDQITGIPGNRGINIPMVREVVRQQKFFIIAGIGSPAVKDGKLAVNVSLTVTSPDGKTTTVIEDHPLLNQTGDGRGIYIRPLGNIEFSSDDTEGRYTYVFSVRDLNSGESAEAKPFHITLGSSASDPKPMDENEYRRFSNNYFRNPAPQRLLAAFDFAIARLEKMPPRKRVISEKITMHFFAECFRLNPHLQEMLAKRSINLSPEMKRVLAMLFADIGSDAVEKYSVALGSEVLTHIKNFRGRNQLYVPEVRNMLHVDLAWAEFYATGKKLPLRKLTASLYRAPFCTPAAHKKRNIPFEKLSPQDKTAVVNGITMYAVQLSMLKNLAGGNNLIRFYLEGMLLKRELPPKNGAIALDLLKKAEYAIAQREKNKKNNEKKNPDGKTVTVQDKK